MPAATAKSPVPVTPPPAPPSIQADLDRLRVLLRDTPVLKALSAGAGEAGHVAARAAAAVAAIVADLADPVRPTAERIELRANLKRAEDELGEANLLVGILVDRRDAVTNDAAESVRIEKYNAAKSRLQRYETDDASSFKHAYIDAVGELLAIMQKLAQDEELIARANADRPFGAPLLESPELLARGERAVQEEILSESEVNLWVSYGSDGEPVPPEFQDKITTVGSREGFMIGTRFPDTVGKNAHSPQAEYYRRRFRVRRIAERVDPVWPLALIQTIKLPGWSGGLDVLNVMPSIMPHDPAAKLAILKAALDSLVAAKVPAPRRERTEYIGLSDGPVLSLVDPSGYHKGVSRPSGTATARRR